MHKNGWNAAHLAAKAGHLHILEILATTDVRWNDLVDLTNSGGSTYHGLNVLHVATCSSKTNIIGYLFDTKNFDINAKSTRSFTPLHLSVRCDGYASVTYPLKRGADASLATDNGSTPLHAAASRDRENMVRLLCEHRCDTLVEDCKGLIPEWYAANKGYSKVADFLRETRAKQEALKGKSQPRTKGTVKPENLRAMRQLQTAIDSSDLELCRLLVASRGTEILELQQFGPMPTSALIHAIFSDQLDIATHLIEAGSPINGRTDTPGYGVFHACAEMGHTSVLETLIQYALLWVSRD